MKPGNVGDLVSDEGVFSQQIVIWCSDVKLFISLRQSFNQLFSIVSQQANRMSLT